MDMRAANGGACRTPSTALPPEEVERRKALDRTFDMAKMRERAESARAAEAAPAPGSTKPRSPLN
jgi:hypothetical protein